MTPIFGRMKEGFNYQIRQCVYAVIFNPEKKKVLTVYNSNGAYFLPGGAVEKNEDFHSCLVRELLEETGYAIIIGDCIGHAQQYFFSSKKEPFLGDGYFYIADIQHKRQAPIDEDHFLSWLDINQIDNVLFHQYHVWAVREGLRRFEQNLENL